MPKNEYWPENNTKENLQLKLENVITMIITFLCIVGFIFAVWFIVQKTPKAEPIPQNRYVAYYGTFTSGSRYCFDSYVVNGNQYIFYDVNGNFVGEIYVSGNNNISIRSR